MSVVIETDKEALLGHIENWEKLSEQASSPNVFYEPFMAIPALENLASGKQPHFYLIYDSDELIGLFPLEIRPSYKRLPVRHLRFWQYKHCYLCTPLIKVGCEQRVIELFFKEIQSTKSLPKLVLWNDIPTSSPVYSALTRYHCGLKFTAHEHAFQRAALKRTASLDSYLNRALSKRFRRELTRKENRLKRAGEVLYRTERPSEPPSSWIDDFLSLELSGWKGAEGSAISSTTTDEAFFRSVLNSAAEMNRLIINSLYLGSQMVAGGCKIIAGQEGFAYKIAYDENYHKASPAYLLELNFLEKFHGSDLKLTKLDSCAEPTNELANRLWCDRETVSSVAIALRRFPESWVLAKVSPLLSQLKRRLTGTKDNKRVSHPTSIKVPPEALKPPTLEFVEQLSSTLEQCNIDEFNSLVMDGVRLLNSDKIPYSLVPYGDRYYLAEHKGIYLNPAQLQGTPVYLGEQFHLQVKYLRELLQSAPIERSLEIGSGLGVVSLELADLIKTREGTDYDERAVLFAKANAALYGDKQINFYLSDLFQNVSGKYDLIIFNPWQPSIDYLDTIASFIESALEHLSDNGRIVLMFTSTIVGRKEPVLNHLSEIFMNNGLTGVRRILTSYYRQDTHTGKKLLESLDIVHISRTTAKKSLLHTENTVQLHKQRLMRLIRSS